MLAIDDSASSFCAREIARHAVHREHRRLPRGERLHQLRVLRRPDEAHQHRALAQQADLGRVGRAHLEDDVGHRPQLARGRRRSRRPAARYASSPICAAVARAGLDRDPEAVLDQLLDDLGHRRDTLLAGLDLAGNSDRQCHASLPGNRRPPVPTGDGVRCPASCHKRRAPRRCAMRNMPRDRFAAHDGPSSDRSSGANAASPSRSSLPATVCGRRSTRQTRRGRLCGREPRADPREEFLVARRGRGIDDERRGHRLAPDVVGNAEHGRGVDAGASLELALHFGRIDVLAAGHDQVRAARVHGAGSRAHRGCRGRRCRGTLPAPAARRRRYPAISIGPPHLDAAGDDAHGRPSAAAGRRRGRRREPRGVRRRHDLRAGLGQSVRKHDRHPPQRGALRAAAAGANAPPTRIARRCPGGVQSGRASSTRASIVGTSDASVTRSASTSAGKRAGIEAIGEHDGAARGEAARQDGQPADARDRHAREPAVVVLPAQVGGARGRRRDERRARQHRAARRAGRARRVDDRRRIRVRHVARALGVGDERGALDRASGAGAAAARARAAPAARTA